jgi:hydrophobic/amphiphilic exporter-1 (mainly G- bacteria), HAE1 family
VATDEHATGVFTTGTHEISTGIDLSHGSRAGGMTALFIKRPVMTTLIMIGILLFGIIAYRQLPVSDLPTVDFPTISVNASLPGASPETMAATVATPLEKQFSTIAGIDNITSTSALGSTSITIQFSLDRSIDAAAQDVNSAISAALPNLPTNIIPPSYRKQNPAAAPILFYSLTSAVLPLQTVDEYGETTIAQQISMVNGVAQVGVWGSQKYAVRVQLDPAQLAARNMSPNTVAKTISNENVYIPTGILYGPSQTTTVYATGQLYSADEFRRLIVEYKNGAPVRLGDIGNVLDDVQNNKSAAWYWSGKDMERTIFLAVTRQPGTNTVEVVNAVKKMMDEIVPQLPKTVKVNLGYDRSVSINGAVRDVKFSLLLALVLVVLVIFLFLRNVVATVIPSLTLPMAVVGTFSIMYVLNFSLDNLSLMALTLAVGFVVDDAIVMLENIVRHMEAGEAPMTAALNGSAEVGFTILSMTLSLAAVFIPLIFMGGVIGKLFNEFALTISVSILVSGFVSLTLTPMLCSRFLRPHHEVQHGKWFNASEQIFTSALNAYERSLEWVMRHRPLTIAFSLAVLGLTGLLFTRVSKGLFPPDDSGQLQATTEAAQGTSFDEMSRLQQRAAKLLSKDPYVQTFTSALGGGGSAGATNQGNIFITLKDPKLRPSADVCVAEITRRLAGIPGFQTFLQNPPTIRIGGRTSKALYQFTLQSPDIDGLYSNALKLVSELQKVPLLTDVTSDLLNRNPEVTVHIDRAKAAPLGLTPASIENALAEAYNAEQISTIYTAVNEYWVVLEVLPKYQSSPLDLTQLYINGANGRVIPLADVAELEPTFGPAAINHSGQLPSVTISFNIPPNGDLGAATAAVQRVASSTLPADITMGFSGQAQAFQSSIQGLGVLLIITVFVIYIILGILYESFVHPITILTALPFATFGALFALWATGVELDVYGYVGLIMLIGIVKKNAIMMIDFAVEAERNEHLTPEQSIIKACSVRFRPIMMTTVAALASTLPIAIGIGSSAASRRPLGIVVVGGLAFSQIVTLYVTPVFYTYLDDFQTWLERVFARLPWAEAPAPVPMAGD